MAEPVPSGSPWGRFLAKARHAHTAWGAVVGDPLLTEYDHDGGRLSIHFDGEHAVFDSIYGRMSWSSGELMYGNGRALEDLDAYESAARQVWGELRGGLRTTRLFREWPAPLRPGVGMEIILTRRIDFEGSWDDAFAMYLTVTDEGDPSTVVVQDARSHATLWDLDVVEWHWDVPLNPGIWHPEEPRVVEPAPRWNSEPHPEAMDQRERHAFFEELARYTLPLDPAASTGFPVQPGDESPHKVIKLRCDRAGLLLSEPITLVYTTAPGTRSHLRGRAAAAAGCPMTVELGVLDRHHGGPGVETMIYGDWTVSSRVTTPPTLLWSWPVLYMYRDKPPGDSMEQHQNWPLPAIDPDQLELRFDGQLAVVCNEATGVTASVGYGVIDDRPVTLTWPGCYPEYGNVP